MTVTAPSRQTARASSPHSVFSAMSDLGSSDSDEGGAEVDQIRRAMREARARKKSLTSRMKLQWERGHQEKSELEAILRATTAKLDDSKKKLAETEFDLREARYELHQLSSAFNKVKDERTHMERFHRTEVQASALKMEEQARVFAEKSAVMALECEKLSRLLEKFCHSQEQTRSDNISRTKRHLLDRALAAVNKLHALAATPEGAEGMEVAAARRLTPKPKSAKDADQAVDSAMLDMCRSLEEENVALADEVETLKEQLTQAKREAAASQLIPHYRLAIVRSRTHATNLAEQVEREKETARALREQLDETYRDLKKVVEDKRRLYKRVSRQGLRADEEEYALRLRHDAEEAEAPPRAPAASAGLERTREAPDRTPVSAISALSPLTAPHSGRRRSPLASGELEEVLKKEIGTLDDQIEMLKEKLGQAALMQSQKILTEVIDSSINQLQRIDPQLKL